MTRPRHDARHGAGGGPAVPMMGMGGGHMMGMTHANDVRYDAYLANDRTLDDPEVVRVAKGGRVRLRIINGGTATAFFVSTPGLASDLHRRRRLALPAVACGQLSARPGPAHRSAGDGAGERRRLPRAGAGRGRALHDRHRAGDGGRAGAKAAVDVGARAAARRSRASSCSLRAANPLAARRPDKTFAVMLGEEAGYRWTINGRIHGEHSPLDVRQGERVEMTFMNPTSMMHPMHLHGHHFQVVVDRRASLRRCRARHRHRAGTHAGHGRLRCRPQGRVVPALPPPLSHGDRHDDGVARGVSRRWAPRSAEGASP